MFLKEGIKFDYSSILKIKTKGLMSNKSKHTHPVIKLIRMLSMIEAIIIMT